MHSNDHIYQFDAHKIDLCSDDNRQDENPQMISSEIARSKKRVKRLRTAMRWQTKCE